MCFRTEALARPRTVLKRFVRDDAGIASVIFGLVIIPLVFMAGAALDYSRAASSKSRLQAAADAAAISAAQNSGLAQAARQQIATNSVLTNLGSLASTLNPKVVETESAGQYRVTVTASQPTTLMQIARLNAVALSVSAAATNSVPGASSTSTTTTTTSTPVNVCMLALSKTASQAFLGNSGATINAPNCEVDVASTASPAAMLNSGVNFTVNNFCVAGVNITNNGATITNGSTSVLKTGCATASDPFASSLPTVTVGACTFSNQNYNGSVTLSPGVYCGGFNFNGTGTVTLSPGLYIFKGVSWNLNSGWTMTGSGVTLYFADSSYLQFNSNAQVSLSAPTSGTYANILMFEKPGLPTSSFTVNGSSASPDCLTGLIYLPSRNITFNSGASVNSAAITVVMNTVIMNGVTWNLTSSAYTIPSATSSTTKTTTTTSTTTTPNVARLVQ
ncbi:MAG TPA: pilus assembly protein TadG-related protein [Methylocystis sp.]